MKFITLLWFLGLSLFNINSYSANLEKEYVLFVGNPGGGKSKIINSLLQKEVAKSGLSIGGGLTKECALYPNPNGNIVYIDTPGLDDINTRADAAKEIEKALKQNGKYRIFFVIDSNGLKTRPADLDTMKIILDAINLTNIEYNIIVNKLTKEELSEVVKDNNAIKLAKSLKAGKYHTYNIRFIPMDLNVLQGNKNFIDFEPEMMEFLSQSSVSIHIPQNCIRTLDGESQEEKLEKARKELERLAEVNEQVRKRTEEAKRQAQEESDKETARFRAEQALVDYRAQVMAGGNDYMGMKSDFKREKNNGCSIF